jgi:glycosyltransferase involved in cell wall biosynthesis
MTSSQRDKIQVLIPAYNAEPHIDEALESLCNQTWWNWEALIIDDGSTDGTKEKLRKWCSRDKRISYKSRINKGLVFTLNELVQWSDSSVIARMDADDVSRPHRLENQLDLLLSLGERSLVGSWVELFGSKSEIWHYRAADNDIRMLSLFGRASMCHGALMGHRSVFTDYPFDTHHERVEELDFFCRLMPDDSISLGNVTEPLYRYRQHESSVVYQFNLPRQTLYRKRIKDYFSSLKISINDSELSLYLDFVYGVQATFSHQQSCILINIVNYINDQLGQKITGYIKEFKRRSKGRISESAFVSLSEAKK